MKKIRFLSALLAMLMVFGAMDSLMVLPIFAADDEEAESEEEEKIDYLTKVFATPEEKLATMELKVSAYNYELYYEKNTGEVALRDTASGQVIFSNPINVAEGFEVASSDGGEAKKTFASADTKALLMSQIVIKFTDNNKETNFYSFTEAAERNQIIVKNMKNGIRVEYTLGREETRKLVPRMIEKSRFEELILANITDARARKKMSAFYVLKDPEDPTLTERGLKELKSSFPITNKMAVYIFDPDAAEREMNEIEGYIKLYCPEYTYETLQEDHNITEYEGEETDPALFKLSLEYYLDEDGLTVRLPANGIRFNADSYSLTYVTVLPYWGAGSSDFTGYTLYPDGAGTLVRFEDLTNLRTLTGQVYGRDYAYHELKGPKNAEVLRMPVFGLVENYECELNATPSEDAPSEEESDIESEEPEQTDESEDEDEEETEEETQTPNTKPASDKEMYHEDRGWFAIIEEGDSLADITTSHGAFVTHRYNSAYTTFYPRPKDSYNLAESISVGANTSYTVVSKRKYTGSYRIRYIMLTDSDIAEKNNITDYYECSYVGMAKAYRDYLEKTGVLTRLTTEETGSDLPLYIESFGIVPTQDTFLSFPVTVKTPLTTFEQLKTMYEGLEAEGITNINFRLRGFANGGMFATVPNHVKFESKVGGNEGYQDFLAYAAEKGFGVFPEFEMSYVVNTKLFDGFSYRTDAVKTIDNRYIAKREYDGTYQLFMSSGNVAISPSVFSKFYNGLKKDLDKLGVSGLSFASLGTDLNSDFDKKDPYNRENNKEFVINLLSDMKEDYGNLMVDGGNAYTYAYVNHILNAPIDSSHFTYASEMVPFFGMVLHGYISFAGDPTNMAGNIAYEMLKMIESGSAPYFTLSYDNLQELKDFTSLNKYYAISYEIWFDDLVSIYKELNELLGSLQTKLIVDHEFLIGERIPTELELIEDAEAEAEAAEEEAEKLQKKQEKEERAKKLADRLAAEAAAERGEEVPDAEDTTEDTTTPVAKEEEEEVEGYKYTKYTIDNGSLVRVTYEDGTTFILNYNSFEVVTEGYTVPATSYIKYQR